VSKKKHGSHQLQLVSTQSVGKTVKKKYGPCHEGHPQLELGGGVLLGASCNHPREGFDIYVGLDWGMARMSHQYPWEPPSKVVEVYFPVTDGKAPKDTAQFKRLVLWLVEQLALGKRIHVGCIGGHGRTGTLIAALVCVVHGNPKAGEWVREHYCKSAIETKEQVEFLQAHFGLDSVVGTKEGPASNYPLLSVDSAPSQWGVYDPMRGRSMWNSDWVVKV